MEGVDISALSDADRSRWRTASAGFVFQPYNLLPMRTALENVELPLVDVTEPEVAEAFPDSKSVNDALGLILRVARTGRLRTQAHEKAKRAIRSRAVRGRKPRS